VPASDIVKGYPVAEGRYVIFTADELAALAARKSRVIDIGLFVALADIDPLFFDRPYHLLPQEAGVKPYRLLCEVLERQERVGIARMVMHNKEHLVAVRCIDDALVLQTLRFADEVLDPGAIEDPPPRPKLAARELAMAEQLVEAMSGDFVPGEHHDEFRDRLRKAIAQKARGKTLTVETDEGDADEGKVLDLMAALKRSLADRGRRRDRDQDDEPEQPRRRRAG
jgi:DNA end-binding protein Ku